MTENWKPVDGFETHYEISDQGRVKRIKAYNGTSVGRILKNKSSGAGYSQVILYKDNQSAPRLVHRLVATAFIAPITKGLEVNHKDGNKTNTNVRNLGL